MTSSFEFHEIEASIYLISEDGTPIPKFVSQQARDLAEIMCRRGQQGISERNVWAWCRNLPSVIRELREVGLSIEGRIVYEGRKAQRIFVLCSKVAFMGAK